MKKITITTTAFCLVTLLIGCANEVNVPETVQVQTAPVTGEVIVKHVLTIELPTIFTDTCRQAHPNDEVAYQSCVTQYINQLIQIINGINPNQLPIGDL